MVHILPTSLVAEAPTLPLVRAAVAEAPPGTFIVPRNLSSHPGVATALRDLAAAGHLTRPCPGIYFKPARPGDDGSGPDAEAVRAGTGVRFVYPDGSPAPTPPSRRSPAATLLTADVLRAQYVDAGRTCAQIGEEFGLSGDTIRRALRTHGIEVRRTGPPNGSRLLGIDDEAVTAAYRGGKSFAEIAAELGCSERTVRRAVARTGPHPRPSRFGDLLGAENLKRRYVDDGASSGEIAAEIGCSGSAVTAALHRHGIEVRSWPARRGLDKILTGEFLHRALVVDRRTYSDIGREVGCDRHTVMAWAQRAGITKPEPEPSLG